MQALIIKRRIAQPQPQHLDIGRQGIRDSAAGWNFQLSQWVDQSVFFIRSMP